MKRLYAAVTALITIWTVSMLFFAVAAYRDDWTWSIIGVAALLMFAGLGGLLIPDAQRAATGEDRRGTFWLMQFFGSFVTTVLLVAALIAWIMGNRTHHDSNAYQTLGLLIFLALLGAGQGVPATFVLFLSRRSQHHHQPLQNGGGVATLPH